MDETTAGGYPPQLVAEQILNGVVLQEKEIVIATSGPRIAILLRSMCPSFYFWIMQKRANKMLADATNKTNSGQAAAVSMKKCPETLKAQKFEKEVNLKKK